MLTLILKKILLVVLRIRLMERIYHGDKSLDDSLPFKFSIFSATVFREPHFSVVIVSQRLKSLSFIPNSNYSIM